MKKFNGYDDAKKAAQYAGSAKLPAGAYVAKIEAVKYESMTWGDVITVRFDIAEGEFKGFFAEQFKNNTSEDKKWKGTARISVPKDDGSEKDGWTKNAFARWTDAFEKSNKGYTWDWDESKWKGLMVGLVYRNAGNVIDGREVTYTEVAFACDVDTVRSGNAPEAKFKAKNGYTGNGSASNGGSSSGSSEGWMNVSDSAEEEIPF